MAMKLFALEELDKQVADTAVETSPEEGEVANVEVEVQEEVAQTEDQAEAIDEGIDAASQLEEVQEVVEKSVEEGEGLTEPAAEAIRIAVEAIAARIGYDPKKVAGLRAIYASESFASPSSRLANTKIALEGISEFLKSLWEKIKAAIASLFAKVADFWDKYVSGLQKTKGALEAMKVRLSKSSGKIKDKVYFEEAPAALVEAFAGKDDIISSVVKKFIAAHASNTLADLEKYGKEISAGLKETGYLNKKVDDIVIPSSGWLVFGKKYTLSVKEDVTSDSFEVEIKEEVSDEREAKLGIAVAEKADVIGLINETIKIISDTIKNKEKVNKFNDEVSKAMIEGEKKLFGEKGSLTSATSEDKQKVRAGIKNTYKFINSVVTLSNKVQASNIKLAKAVIAYANFCLKNYK